MRYSPTRPKSPSTPLCGHAFFAPSSWSCPRRSLSTQRPHGHNVCYSDFLTNGENLLLSQSLSGKLYWGYIENLLMKDENVTLHPCSMKMDEAIEIAKRRTLCISVSDPRLGNCVLLRFNILANKSWRSDRNNTPTFIYQRGDRMGGVEVTDLVLMRLALGGAVDIISQDARGEKHVDEALTLDYLCAMREISHNPSATRNLQRFCDRLGPVGEGSSCPKEQISYSENEKQEKLRELSGSSLSEDEGECLSDLVPWRGIWHDACAHSTPAEHVPTQAGMEVEETGYSTTYRIMTLLGTGLTKRGQRMLEAEKQKFELKKARREKRPERFEEPAEEKNFPLKKAAYKFLSYIARLKLEIFVSAPENVYHERKPCTSTARIDAGLAGAGAEIGGLVRETVTTVEITDATSTTSSRLCPSSFVLDVATTAEGNTSSEAARLANISRPQRNSYARERLSDDHRHSIDGVPLRHNLSSGEDSSGSKITTREIPAFSFDSAAECPNNRESNCAIDKEDDPSNDEDENLRNSLCLRQSARCETSYREEFQTQHQHSYEDAYDADDDFDSTSPESLHPFTRYPSSTTSHFLPRMQDDTNFKRGKDSI